MKYNYHVLVQRILTFGAVILLCLPDSVAGPIVTPGPVHADYLKFSYLVGYLGFTQLVSAQLWDARSLWNALY